MDRRNRGPRSKYVSRDESGQTFCMHLDKCVKHASDILEQRSSDDFFSNAAGPTRLHLLLTVKLFGGSELQIHS